MDMKTKPWSVEEDRFLTENYRTLSPEMIASHLKRTVKAVQVRGSRLKITTDPGKPFTDDEMALMRELAPSLSCEEVAKRLGRTTGAVRKKVKKLGIRWHRLKGRHGGKGTSLYSRWKHMRSRCRDKKNPRWKHYGGRGIRICEEWNDYQCFRDWSLANGFEPNLSIDRIDNNGHYEPANCRWVNQSEQMNNTRCNRIIKAFGIEKTMRRWIDDYRCVVSYHRLKYRLNDGWAPERAITEPVHGPPVISAYGEVKTAKEWQIDARCGVSAALIRARIRKGWTNEKAISTPLRYTIGE